MNAYSPDSRRITLWRALRRKIRFATGQDRHRLLRGFSDEIRFITAMAAKSASAQNCRDLEKCLELADILAVLTGGLMLVDPYNPGWPGRDRLVVGETDYLVAVCAALTIMGFFSPEYVAGMVEAAERGEAAHIPGLDYSPIVGGMTTATAWDIAVESRQRKTTWRGGPERLLSGRDWADPAWKVSPALWHTHVIIKAGSPEATRCRTLPQTASGQPAGLYVVVATPNREAAELAAFWRESGWDAFAFGSGDRLRLYDALAEEPESEKPRAIMLGVGSASPAAGSGNPDGEAHLLGKLSDDQFNSLMGEFFESIG